MGVRSLKVTAGHRNNDGCWYEYSIVSVPRMALRPYTILVQHAKHTPCTLSWTAEGRQAGRRQGRSKGRMCGREGRRE